MKKRKERKGKTEIERVDFDFDEVSTKEEESLVDFSQSHGGFLLIYIIQQCYPLIVIVQRWICTITVCSILCFVCRALSVVKSTLFFLYMGKGKTKENTMKRNAGKWKG